MTGLSATTAFDDGWIVPVLAILPVALVPVVRRLALCERRFKDSRRRKRPPRGRRKWSILYTYSVLGGLIGVVVVSAVIDSGEFRANLLVGSFAVAVFSARYSLDFTLLAEATLFGGHFFLSLAVAVALAFLEAVAGAVTLAVASMSARPGIKLVNFYACATGGLMVWPLVLGIAQDHNSAIGLFSIAFLILPLGNSQCLGLDQRAQTFCGLAQFSRIFGQRLALVQHGYFIAQHHLCGNATRVLERPVCLNKSACCQRMPSPLRCPPVNALQQHR